MDGAHQPRSFGSVGTPLTALPRARLAGALICLMIVVSVIHGIVGDAFPAWPAGLLAWAVGALLFAGVLNFQRIQVAIMCLAGLAGIVLASSAGDFGWWPQLIEGNQAILAMLAMVTFLRLVTRTGAHVGESLPHGTGAIGQTLLATHMLGAVINISATYIVGQRISRDGSLTPLQAKVVSRAFVAGACWSPFFASMGVVVLYVPNVDVFAVASHNLLLAAFLIAYSAWDLKADPGIGEFVGFPIHAEALTVPLLLAMLVFALHAIPASLSILTIIVIAAAGCFFLLRVREPPGETRDLLRHHLTFELSRMGAEFALFLGAAVLSAGIAATVRVMDFAFVVDPSSAAEAIGLMCVLAGLSLVGVHPVISIASLASLFPPVVSHPDLIALMALMAWSVALGASPFSGATLALQGRFGIPSTQFLRWNFRYMLVGLVFGSLLLTVYDRVYLP